MKCIYCESAEANSKEHIIQSALGSNLKSSIILCASCNNYFSTKESGYVDQSIVNAFSAFRNFFSIWGDRNTPPPILKNIGTKSGKKYDIAPGLVPFIPGSIRSEKNNNDGTFEINISSQNEEKAREQLSHLNNQYGSKNLIYKYMQLEKEYLDEPLHFEFQFGGKSILKAVMKNLYNFLFWLQRDQSQVIDVNASDLKISREYIRYDINGNKFYSSLDFLNPTPYHLSDKDISHYISVFRKNKMIYGYFTLFGQITYTAILSENSEGDDFRYGFSINPICTMLVFT
ncbi:HNH endonuclease [Leptospira wolffii]|uniref:HNH endonuclease n=1 Tax=Leptospira wolffii TaxID=409998 RepID=UPI0002E9373B|nr:HNH endonuclease [Leptospira wolffii]